MSSKITSKKPLTIAERLRLFDAATRRIRRRKWKGPVPKGRGWTRKELYDRGHGVETKHPELESDPE